MEHSARVECSTPLPEEIFTAWGNGNRPTPAYYRHPCDDIDPPPPDLAKIEAVRRDAQEEALQWFRRLIHPELPEPHTARERQAYANAQARRLAVIAFRLDGGPEAGLRLGDYARALGVSPSRLSEINKEITPLLPDTIHF